MDTGISMVAVAVGSSSIWHCEHLPETNKSQGSTGKKLRDTAEGEADLLLEIHTCICMYQHILPLEPEDSEEVPQRSG